MTRFIARRQSAKPRADLAQRRARTRRRAVSLLEPLENRTLLAYTFAYNAATHMATATGDATTGSLLIAPLGGFLEHSQDGGATFSSSWGGLMVPAASTETVNITVSTGNGSSLQLGGGTGHGPASALFAAFKIVAPAGNTTDTATIDDSGSSATSTYTINTQNGTVTGPGIDYNESSGAPFGGGVTLKGSAANGDVFDVPAILHSLVGAAEPFTIITAANTGTVNVGNVGQLSIGSPLAIFGAGATTTVNINDASGTTNGTATLDDLSGNPNAPFEVTGLSQSPIEYGAGVTALNINGGTNGAAGVTNNVNNTQAGTTTTLSGGPNHNSFNLSNAAAAGGLDNLAGPVVVNGGMSHTDAVTLDDSAFGASDTYAITSTTVSRAFFGGLTYGGVGALTLNAETGNNVINIASTAASAVTTVNNQGGAVVTNVTGQGVAAGTTLHLNGSGADTLNYNAGGLTPTITAGAVAGEAIVSLPGFGSVDAKNYASINATSIAPVTITPGPAASLTSVEGFRLTDAIVATFTFPQTSIATPPGVPASAFTASIDWGDPSPDPAAGTITQDASNPSVYYVTGTHTFTEQGTFTVASTVSFAGGTFTSTIGGVPVTVTLPPSGPTAGASATATVTQGPLAVSAFPIVGTEGTAIAAGPIATFIDAGGADPVTSYSAMITITDSTGTAVVSVPATSITQNGTAAQYTVNTPAFTLPEEGTYQVTVAVSDSDTPSPLTVSGAAYAVIADAALTAGTAVALTPSTGVALPASTVVGTFTDANTAAPATDFTATIAWGDGSPTSLGTIVATSTAGQFNVEAGHTYARPGTFPIHINVLDEGGSTTTLTGTATVTDQAVTGATRSFTAVEGQSTGLFVLATYTDPNTLATVANENAQLAVGGWGDGTPTAAGVTLVVQQTGVTPLTSPTNPGAPIFEVLGTHTYTEETPPGLPNTLSVVITTLGGVATTLTSPPGGGVTVLDAPLTSSNGTEITGVEGIANPAATLLGTFTDANQGATTADFLPTPGGNGGSVVVNWGDGSAPQMLMAANLRANGSPQGVIFGIAASHTYAQAGTYAYTVVVTDDGGATTAISGSAIIADAVLTASPAPAQPTVSTTEAKLFPVPVFAPPVFQGPVASFTDANPISTTADFTATIDWGDGTPPSAGTVSQPGGAGTAYIVSGSHTFADSGVNGGSRNVPIQVIVRDDDGETLTVANTATVADNPIVVTGALNPTSDSGLSTGTPNVTNVKQPDFSGTSEPFSLITLFATRSPGGTPTRIGQVEAGSDGSWNIASSISLADGHYSITATAIDQFGVTTTTAPATIVSDVLIDTVGPVIDGMFFNRLNGQVDYIIKDPANPDGSTPAGVWVNSLLDSSNYLLTKVHANRTFTGQFLVTNVTTTPDPTIPHAFDVAVTFNGGKSIRGGFYLFTIRDASNGNSSVQDLAENHLDGVFYGSFPSGNGINGSDFVAELQSFHNKVFAPQTIIGTSNGANRGVGGLPVGPVHSGMFVTTVPRGGSPLFSTTTSPVTGDPPAGGKHSKSTHHMVIKARPAVSAHPAAPGHSQTVKPSLVKSNIHPRGPRHK
jgi:hypothetical protein